MPLEKHLVLDTRPQRHEILRFADSAQNAEHENLYTKVREQDSNLCGEDRLGTGAGQLGIYKVALFL